MFGKKDFRLSLDSKTKERREKEKTPLIYHDGGKQMPRKYMFFRTKMVDEQKQRASAGMHMQPYLMHPIPHYAIQIVTLQ